MAMRLMSPIERVSDTSRLSPATESGAIPNWDWQGRSAPLPSAGV